MQLWTEAQTYISLAALAGLEIVLGIDNIVFISILTGKLPPEQRATARRLGLLFALGSRIALLFSISWVMGLSTPFFSVFDQAMSGRSLILLGGGLFLLGKSTLEIYESLEVPADHHTGSGRHKTAQNMVFLLIQIMLLDIVFSLDSVITAVGMVDHLSIMVVAMLIAVGIMLLFANAVGDFVTDHPSIKILALAFLILVGAMLVSEAFEGHVHKGYVYFAMAFSMGIELLNMRFRRNRRVVELNTLEAPQE